MMNPKVLIVDDQPLVLGVVQEILSRGPYHVSSASSAEEALKNRRLALHASNGMMTAL